jgi:hypothetical protein
MIADHLLHRWCLLDDINKWLIAITASSSAVAGWTLWSTPGLKLVWAFLASASAILAITHTALGVQQRIKNWEDAKKSFAVLRIDLNSLRQDMTIEPEFYIEDVMKKMKSLRSRYCDQMSRLSPDTLRTKKLEFKIQCILNKTIADQIQG